MRDDYLKRVKNYIFDNRFSRALLIDGDWGCGKSFFVKNDLIPEIEKTQVEEKKEDDNSQEEKSYSALMISLYGISEVESIRSAIYSAYLEKITEITDNDLVKNALKHVKVFGTTMLKGLSNHLGVDEEVNNCLNQIKDEVLHKNKDSIILIFDDIERCRIDIIELMGFLNDLCENNGYRIILIANEDEISRQENDIALAIQTQTALIDLYGKQFHSIKNNESKHLSGSKEKDICEGLHRNRADVKDEMIKSSLENHRNILFERNTLYKRTREKLIGLTIRFSSNLNEVYEDVLNNSILDETIKRYLREKKTLVVDAFDSQSHENLRTLISFFISVEAIMTTLNDLDKGYDVKTKEIIEREKNRLLQYMIRTAINRAKGINLPILNNGIRYGLVNKGLFSKEKSYYKYTFVDEYWDTLVANSEVINADFIARLNECISAENDRKNDEAHSELALFKLREWYYHDDDEVKEDIKKLKEELSEKKYYPYEFKEIILILMGINSAELGMKMKTSDNMQVEKYEDSVDNTTYPLSESCEKIQNKNESSNINYVPWDQENIDEYVNLMMQYTKEDDFSVTEDMLRVLSEDLSLVQEYKRHVKPLIEWVHNKELSELKKSDGGQDAFEINGEELYNFFKGRRDTYLLKRQFLSLYGHDRIECKIKESKTQYLLELAGAIGAVYNFGNLREFFPDDYEVVNQIWLDLKKDRETDRSRFNPAKERTKEMALRRLENDFESYRNKLQDLNEVIEINIGV